MAAEFGPESPVYPVDMSVRHAFRYTPDQCDVRAAMAACHTTQLWLLLGITAKIQSYPAN